jgi:hypothetical protein
MTAVVTWLKGMSKLPAFGGYTTSALNQQKVQSGSLHFGERLPLPFFGVR